MMTFIWVVGFIVLVIVGNKMHKKRLEHMTPKNNTVVSGGGTTSTDSGRHNDGSVTPPSNGNTAI